MRPLYDLLIVGGGINGVGIARDAAGRGLSVLLVEQDDLAAHTSSWSTKLIHGGLRYLEHYEFRLVGEALAEREVLLRAAPHLIEPLSFVLPHEPHLRPAWMIRAGLFLYDRLGGRMTLPRSFASSSTTRRGAPASSRAFHAASSTPTRASTTRGSWWRTRSTRRRAAPTAHRRALRQRGARRRRGRGSWRAPTARSRCGARRS
jgi:glycerol-3-phosphate dehydrogenase